MTTAASDAATTEVVTAAGEATTVGEATTTGEAKTTGEATTTKPVTASTPGQYYFSATLYKKLLILK